MSTHINTIVGRAEKKWNPTDKKVEYGPSELSITRFYGGEKEGDMIQITIDNPDIGYIQINKNQVEELIVILQNCFNRDVYPSE